MASGLHNWSVYLSFFSNPDVNFDEILSLMEMEVMADLKNYINNTAAMMWRHNERFLMCSFVVMTELVQAHKSNLKLQRGVWA